MRILLIHTCGAEGSVALADDAGVRVSVALGARGAAEGVMGAVREVMGGMMELGGVGVVTGPGSFTGVRTGLSVGKGLCVARGIPLVGVSRLALVARGEGLVMGVVDAGRGEFYLGRYRDGVRELEALVGMEELRREIAGGERVVACEAKVISALAGMEVEEVREPSAGDALALVRAGLGAGVDDVLGDANYLRRTDAEIFAKAAGRV